MEKLILCLDILLLTKRYMIGEYHSFFSLSNFDLFLDMLLFLADFRDKFVYGTYDFRLLMLDLVSMNTYWRTVWLGLGTILEMLTLQAFIIGTSALLRWRKWYTTHINFLVTI